MGFLGPARSCPGRGHDRVPPDAPPAARWPWLLALPAGYVLVFGPLLVLQATGNFAWLPDFAGLCCLLVALACLAYAPRAWSRQTGGSGAWALTLTLLGAIAGVYRIITLGNYLHDSHLIKVSLAELLILLAAVALVTPDAARITPLGPDQAATMPQPHHLRSPIILQDMHIQQPLPAGGCPAGWATLPGGPTPGQCYHRAGTPVTITSAAVSPVFSFRPPTAAGQQAAPVQYGFWITLDAADVSALAAVIPTASGPQGPPAASVVTSVATIPAISVAGRTWVLLGFATRFAGREFEATLPSRTQALQRMLAASGRGGRHHGLSRGPGRPAQTRGHLLARSFAQTQALAEGPAAKGHARNGSSCAPPRRRGRRGGHAEHGGLAEHPIARLDWRATDGSRGC